MGRVTPDPLAHPVGLPPGPYRVEWPAEQGGAFTLWGRQGTPPDFKDGWAIPLVASGVDTAMYALCDMLNAASPETTPAPDAGDGWLRHRVALALSTSKHKLVRAVPDGVACICGQYDDSDHGIEASELWRDHLIRAATDVLSASEAGHRTREPHDCFLMSCRDLGPEVVALYDRLTALSSQPAPDPAVIAAEGFTGHKPLPNGKCEHRWRNRQTKAVTCRFADGWHAGQAAALSSPETTPAPDDGLRAALEQWATRTTPWTGPESMTAEGGYNAAVEEVAALLNYHRAALSSPETTPAGVLDEAALREARAEIEALFQEELTGGAATSRLVAESLSRRTLAILDALAAALGRSGSGGGRG